MAYVDDDGSSGSGDDVTMLDGHNKRQSVTPGGSGRAKRSRKATGDAIVDAMLEIAAASKMRAAAIMKNEDRFSISKCIKVLDEMQGMFSTIPVAFSDRGMLRDTAGVMIDEQLAIFLNIIGH
ncbi:hypothetical protein OIU78_000895 [Salix suchowensis]|nr:hypothetical protein OIU78_000895 [Salix suchowensis]